MQDTPKPTRTDPCCDTDPEAAREQIRLLRAAGIVGRIAALCEMTDEAFEMSRQGLRRARPGATEREIDLALVELLYGPELARGVRNRLADGA